MDGGLGEQILKKNPHHWRHYYHDYNGMATRYIYIYTYI